MKSFDYNISLDVSESQSQVSLPMKKGDNKRTIYITLRNGGIPYDLGSDCLAVLSAVKSDGNILENNCVISGNTVIYKITSQTTSVSGLVECEIKLYGVENDLVTSARFSIVVDERLVSEDEIESTSEYSALTALYSQTNGLKNEIEYKLQNNEFKGEKGDKGDKGEQGIQGIQGVQGEKGDKGDKGDIGERGPQGIQGVQGIQGERGPQGEQGLQGIQGLQGEQGVQGEKGEKGDMPTLDEISNALKGNTCGTDLVIDDISPVEHIVDVRVYGKNIIPYPYATKTATISGVTFTDNGDGTVTVSGTAEEDIIYAPINQQTAFLLPAGTYTLSGGLSKSVYLQGKVKEDDSVSVTDTGNGVQFTLIENLHCRFNIRITAGTTVNATIKPQLEVGTVATEYTPYVNPLAVKLKICGKNLFDGQWEPGAINSSTGEKTTNSTSIRTVNYIPVKPNSTYHFSFADGASYFPYSYDVNHNFVAYKGMKKGSFYLTMNDNEHYLIIVQYGSTTPPKNAQIEIGSVGTDYEEYKEFREYTPTADGTVEGVRSLYPNMTMFADDGIIINCEYNKDINKVVEQLVNAIISLGGNV